MVIAIVFGATGMTDAFFVAFRIPNLFRRMFAEGAFSLAFVPVFSEYREKHSEEELRDLRDHTAGALTLVLFIITVIGILAAPWIIRLFAPGFETGSDRYELAVNMLRITFPYLLFISLTALAAGILNTYNRFAVPAFAPVLLNIAMIGAAIWASSQQDKPIEALAWGVFIAGIAQLMLQVPALMRIGMLPRPRFRRAHEGVKKIMGLMAPALFGSSVAQINILINTLIASFLISGSISWLYYSDRFVELPLALFGVAIGTGAGISSFSGKSPFSSGVCTFAMGLFCEPVSGLPFPGIALITAIAATTAISAAAITAVCLIENFMILFLSISCWFPCGVLSQTIASSMSLSTKALLGRSLSAESFISLSMFSFFICPAP